MVVSYADDTNCSFNFVNKKLRCGPCQGIAPHFEQFPKKYPQVIFLKVDVDKCQETAVSQDVKAMPTFVFYRNKVGTHT